MSESSIVQFGNPILRKPAKSLTASQIKSEATQALISEMITLLRDRKLGVGLAAPQVGKSLALAVISIHPTPHRPKVEPFDLVIMNPEIVATKGKKRLQWEGCISSGDGEAGLFARVPRYPAIELAYTGLDGQPKQTWFSGLPAHVIQHEVDHLKGILFVDNVLDSSTYMTYHEYKKQRKNLQKQNNYSDVL